MVETLQSTTSLDIEIVPWIPKSELDGYFKKSRVFLGLSISDGLPSSLVEAIASGTFPIQSKNSAGSVLINHGVNGFLVDPWDLDSVTDAIRRAIQEDDLVCSAQSIGKGILETRFDYRIGLEKVKDLYSGSFQEFNLR
jgi:glycosyltransferase involved in cell wall biosynthesis